MSALTYVSLISLVCVLYLLYLSSHVARYYAKMILCGIVIQVASIILIPVMMMRPKHFGNKRLFSWVVEFLSKLLHLKWEVRGKENYTEKSGCVLLLNHQSVIDNIAMTMVFPLMTNGTVVMKKEALLFWGPFGIVNWLCGAVFVDRGNAVKARASFKQLADIVAIKKTQLIIFPEGTRNRSDTLLPFKKGAFHLAIDSQAPLQPIVMSAYYFMDDQKKYFNSGNSIISILPPIPTTGMTKDDLNQLIADTWGTMDKEYKAISEEAAAKAKKGN